jgi:hypothetical protein
VHEKLKELGFKINDSDKDHTDMIEAMEKVRFIKFTRYGIDNERNSDRGDKYMTNEEECVVDSIIESINRRTKIDFSKCKDDRKDVKIGDKVAMLFFNNTDWDAGKLENISGKLGISIEEGVVGFVEDAYHVVKINR